MGKRKILQGIVISDKMDRTITVEVRRLTPHSLYNKVIRRRTRVNAHDEANAAQAGDVVQVVESRPFSKTKRWALLQIVRRVVESEERSGNDSTQ